MRIFVIPEEPEYNVEMRMLEVTDPAHADLFNKMSAQFLENDAYFKGQLEQVKKDMENVASDEKITEIVQGKLDHVKQELQGQIAVKADKSVLYKVTIPASAWTGESVPYIVQVAVEGLTGAEEENVHIAIDDTATDEQTLAWMEACIPGGKNLENAITLKAFGEKPAIDIPIYVLREGDSGDGTTGGDIPIACGCTAITEEQIIEIVRGEG